MPNKLPLLISVPHGGDWIPDELQDRIALTPRDIFEDGDPLTREIYDVKSEVMAWHDTLVARAIVDLNRAPDDRPPGNPDGVIKTMTTMQHTVYKPGKFPTTSEIEAILNKYYFPWHQELERLQALPDLKAGIDCHTMLTKSPPISQQPGIHRPLVCLSNRGDHRGKPLHPNRPVTCPPEWLHFLAESFSVAFAIPLGDIQMNQPFSGGHITQAYAWKPLPRIQIELNRDWYLSPDWFNAEKLQVHSERLHNLRKMMLSVFKQFCDMIE